MRFAVIAAVFASTVIAQSTTYVTTSVTITSCAATVTNCPARSTVTSVTSYPITMPLSTGSTSKSSTFLSSRVIVPTGASSKATNGTTYVTPTIKPTSSVVPVSSAPVSSAKSTSSAVTITVSACPSTSSGASSKPASVPASVPATKPASSAPSSVPSGVPVTSKNGTSVTTSTLPKFTGGASTMSGSIVVAGLAGLAAVVFA